MSKKKTILIIALLSMSIFVYASKITQIEYSAGKTQFIKYIAGSYFFGGSTTTAKSNPGVWISSNGIIGLIGNILMSPLKTVDGRDVSADGVTLDALSTSTGTYLTDKSSPTTTGQWEFQKPVLISSGIEGTGDVVITGNRFVEIWTKTAGGIKNLVAKFFDDIIEIYTDVDIDGTLNMLDNRITHISTTPLSASDATSKAYVDYLESLLMKYSEYDPEKDGYVNKADTATYAHNSSTSIYSESTGNYIPTQNLDMFGFGIDNSTTIPYSPTSESLITAKYVYENAVNLKAIVIGTTAAETSNPNFELFGLSASCLVTKDGTMIAKIDGDMTASLKDTLIEYELRCSTSADYSGEIIVGVAKYNTAIAGESFPISISTHRYLDETNIGKTFYYRVMWRTDNGTIANDNNYPDVPNRKIVINFYPNFSNINYEE